MKLKSMAFMFGHGLSVHFSRLYAEHYCMQVDFIASLVCDNSFFVQSLPYYTKMETLNMSDNDEDMQYFEPSSQKQRALV